MQLLHVHRLVQAVLVDMLDEKTQRQWALRTVLLVNHVFPEVEIATWQHCQRYLAHALCCAALIKKWDLEIVEAEPSPL